MKLEKLESRRLFNAALTSAVPDVSGGLTSVNLTPYFSDTNQYVRLVTTLGNIDIELRTAQTPNTVANFLSYVNSGAYNGTIIHRAATDSNGNPFVLQMGGYLPSGSHIATGAPITSEHAGDIPNANGEINTTGTVSFALSSSEDSATSEFFINMEDNSFLDAQQQSDGSTEHFTVFGDVVNGTFATAQNYFNPADATIVNAGSPFDTLPVVNFTSGQATLNTNNYTFINSAGLVAQPLTFTATSDNPNIVRPSTTGGSLTLSYPGSGAGTAHVTVKATSLDGSVATSTFSVTRADITGPTATVSGPVVASDNSSFKFNVTYHDNVSVKSATLDSSDIAVTGPHGFTQIATLVSPGLVDGATVVATYQVNAPSGVFPTSDGGTYSFIARAGQVTDINGNALATGTIGSLPVQFIAAASRPDLVGSIKAVKPTTLLPGVNTNSATVTVKNNGQTPAKGTVAVNLYATLTNSLTGAILLGTKKVNLSLIHNGTMDVPFTYKTPTVGTAGNYHLLAFVDANSQIDESNENNNSALGQVVKIAPPTVDLAISLGKLPTSVKAGKQTTIPVTLKNNGNVDARGNALIKIAASIDRIADSTDKVLFTLPVKIDIKPGSTATVSVTFVPNKSISPKGMEFLGAQVTFNGSPADSIPGNNVAFSTKKIAFS